MICPNCGTTLSFQKKQCDRCGEDLSIYKKIISISNQCYNNGLTKAKVRDLSGAVEALKKSVHFNKKNINARNLLGLIYLEMGETVAALSEWVISKHFQEEDNDADAYIQEMQSNPSRLESMNQTVKKYNLALQLARQGNIDLSMMQLKKVTGLNAKFLRAQQLLALLYIQTEEKEKAIKCLQRARKIDINNTMTLDYLRELEVPDAITDAKKGFNETRPKLKRDENASFAPPNSYKEEKPNILAWCNLVIGAVIGIAVVYFLMVPTIEKRIASEYRIAVVEHSEELAAKDATVSTLENDKTELEAKLEKLKLENKELQDTVSDETLYDNLFLAAKRYVQGKSVESAEVLMKIDLDKLERPEAINLFKALRATTYKEASRTLYEEGSVLYEKYKYTEALPYFERSLQADQDNLDAMYFLGRCHHRLGEKEKAAEYYNKIINDYPDSSKVNKAKQQLRSLG